MTPVVFLGPDGTHRPSVSLAPARSESPPDPGWVGRPGDAFPFGFSITPPADWPAEWSFSGGITATELWVSPSWISGVWPHDLASFGGQFGATAPSSGLGTASLVASGGSLWRWGGGDCGATRGTIFDFPGPTASAASAAPGDPVTFVGSYVPAAMNAYFGGWVIQRQDGAGLLGDLAGIVIAQNVLTVRFLRGGDYSVMMIDNGVWLTVHVEPAAWERTIAFDVIDEQGAVSGNPDAYDGSGINMASVSVKLNDVSIPSTRWNPTDVAGVTTASVRYAGKRFTIVLRPPDPVSLSETNHVRVEARDNAGNSLANDTLDYDFSGGQGGQ